MCYHLEEEGLYQHHFVCHAVCLYVTQSVCVSHSLFVCHAVCLCVTQPVCVSCSLFACITKTHLHAHSYGYIPAPLHLNLLLLLILLLLPLFSRTCFAKKNYIYNIEYSYNYIIISGILGVPKT